MSFLQTSKVKRYSGVEMPFLGPGVFRSKEGEEVETAVKCGLETGYRSIDGLDNHGRMGADPDHFNF